MSETSKHLNETLPYLKGNGVDIGCGDDPVRPDCIAIDIPQENYECYNGGGASSKANLRAFADDLPFKDHTLDWVYCAVPGGIVETPEGPKKVEDVKIGDKVLGRNGFVTVLGTSRSSFCGDVFNVKTSKGTAIVTGNHPIATPLGWLDADQLRESDYVFLRPTEIKTTDFVDSVYVELGVASCPSGTSLFTKNVVVGNATLTKFFKEKSLPVFQFQVGQQKICESQSRMVVSLNADSSPRLAPFSTRTGGSEEKDVIVFQDSADFVEQDRTGIRNLNMGSDAKLIRQNRGNADAYAPFPIYNSSEPSDVCERVHSVYIQHYSGYVVNIETADATFFLNGLLTHNSSHLLEDFPLEEWTTLLREWVRVLKPGGTLVILVPEARLWAQALAAGQPPNCAHQHEPNFGELTALAPQLGLTTVRESMVGDYSILFVAQKS